VHEGESTQGSLHIKFFLEDYKDVQDFGIEFHYSWLIILISLVGYGESRYSVFYQSLGKCHATKFTTLWRTSDAKKGKENYTIFAMILEEM
jgi:hypothetical protein